MADRKIYQRLLNARSNQTQRQRKSGLRRICENHSRLGVNRDHVEKIDFYGKCFRLSNNISPQKQPT